MWTTCVVSFNSTRYVTCKTTCVVSSNSTLLWDRLCKLSCLVLIQHMGHARQLVLFRLIQHIMGQARQLVLFRLIQHIMGQAWQIVLFPLIQHTGQAIQLVLFRSNSTCGTGKTAEFSIWDRLCKLRCFVQIKHGQARQLVLFRLIEHNYNGTGRTICVILFKFNIWDRYDNLCCFV